MILNDSILFFFENYLDFSFSFSNLCTVILNVEDINLYRRGERRTRRPLSPDEHSGLENRCQFPISTMVLRKYKTNDDEKRKTDFDTL
jgi:hypothetical protein